MSFEIEPNSRAHELNECINNQSKTLFIGGWFSTCGNCHGNSNPHEESHTTVPGEDSEGCGVIWEFVSSDECRPELIQNMRPDLQWREPEDHEIGISQQTERGVIGDMQQLGPFRTEDITGRDN